MKRNYNIEDILKENIARKKKFFDKYDPVTGEGSVAVPRTKVTIGNYDEGDFGELWLPDDMLKEEYGVQDLIRAGSTKKFLAQHDNIQEKYVQQESMDAVMLDFAKIRMEYDFEYWAYTCIRIKDKESGQDVPFRLNYAQRAHLLPALENQRRAEQPIRIILLKARQWGGSTLTQLYMLWIQMVHKTGWNSVIAAHKKSGSRTIRGMVTKAINYYPTDLFGKFSLSRWENSNSTSIIEGRNDKITIGTAQVPDSVRSEDIAMAHLSEVAYWQDAETIKPEDLIASIVGSILRIPYSLVVLESTANGTGNFFHSEWLAATSDDPNLRSDKTPVFVPWFDIEIYTEEVNDASALVESFDDYQWSLWDLGATLEAINWWRNKRREMRGAGLAKMKAEYPSTAIEAFVSTGQAVFPLAHCKEMEKTCRLPLKRGFLQGLATEGKKCRLALQFVADENGLLSIWKFPEKKPYIANRYLVVVDIGGRSERADYSVIAVFDRADRIGGGKDEIVAQWRGHIDHDLLCWIAVQVATFYNDALLVIEANTLETTGATDGDHTAFVLEKIADVYSNLYARQDPERLKQGLPSKWGFHTNRATKTQVIDNEVMMYRTQGYVERDQEAVNEHAVYEKRNNSFAAKEGHHDDILMTRAIGEYVSDLQMPAPKHMNLVQRAVKKAVGGVSDFR